MLPGQTTLQALLGQPAGQQVQVEGAQLPGWQLRGSNEPQTRIMLLVV
jgi:hypothetical protein